MMRSLAGMETRRRFRGPVARYGGSVVSVLALVVFTLYATSAWSQRKDCVDCHKDFKKQMAKRYVHKPAKESCETCHKRHGFAQELVLQKKLPALCVDCHANVKHEIDSLKAHKALELGGCTVCHDPHASDHKGFLRQTADGSSVCLRCHDGLSAVMAAKDTHDPFRKGNCAACHAPHASDQTALLLNTERAVCETCHKDAMSKHKFAAAADYACSDCHDPHASSKQAPLARYAHGPFSKGECDACHSLERGRVVVTKEFPAKDLCATCHDDKTRLVQGADSHFGDDARKAAGSKTCMECHTPHTSDFESLLADKEMEVCFKCHATLAKAGTFRGIMHRPYAEGKCSACHEPHGGGGKHHLVQEASALCASCHEEFATPRDRTQFRHEAMELLECVDCHSAHAAQNPALMSNSLASMCHSCHEKEKFSVVHDPYGSSTCNVCHKNHSPRPRLLFAGQNGTCVQCHPSIAQRAGAAVKHPPMQQESCSRCHVPHGGEHSGLLAQPQADLCASCHDIAKLVVQLPARDANRGPRPVPKLHKPVTDGNCAGCHDPHGSALASLVHRGGGDLCFGCHTAEKVSFAQGNVHKPVADGECSTCHTPHGATGASLRKLPEPDLCTQCHDFAKAPLLGSHEGMDAAVAKCTTCHNPHNSQGVKLLNAVVHEPFADGDCATCHDGPRGTGGVGTVPADICMICHDEKKEGKGHQHVAGGCTKCHSPHASRFESLLLGSTSLCSSCHQDVLDAKAAPGHTVQLHQPIKDGSCLQCHKLHDPPAAKFLSRSQGELCAGCHSSIADRGTHLTKHDPFAKGKCSSCHATHASSDRHLLQKEERQLCKSCHRLETAAMASAHKKMPLSGEGCTSCHDPHSTQKAASSLMRPALHYPYEEGDCAACHGTDGRPPASVTVCGECHDKKGDQAHNAGRVKGGRQSVQVCMDCHSPHAGHGRLFRRMTERETCFQCHERKEFTKKVVHGALESGCTTCHDVHKNNFELLRRETVNDLCLDCHQAASMHAHPTGSKYQDPRTGGPLLCTSCHTPHSSDHEHMLTFDHRRDLCVQCHKAGTMKVH